MQRQMIVILIGITLAGTIGATPAEKKTEPAPRSQPAKSAPQSQPARPAPQSQPARLQVKQLTQMFLDEEISASQYELGKRLLNAVPGSPDARDERRKAFEALLNGRLAPEALQLELSDGQPHPRPEDANLDRPEHIYSIPSWVHEILWGHDQKLWKQYNICLDVNPFCLSGDFDGDGKLDLAMMTRERKTGKRTIIIFHQRTKRYYVWPEEVSWCDAWSVYPKERVKSFWEDRAVVLKAQAILAENPENASGLIYWDGKKYCWYQMSD